MTHTWTALLVSLGILSLLGCASKSVDYDLPSVETVNQPEWTQEVKAERDSVYLVTKVQLDQQSDMTKSIQLAQSKLNTLLQKKIETIVSDFLRSKTPPYPEEHIFKSLSSLPQTLEKIMVHVEVKDAWERSGEIAVLFAFDHEEVAMVIIRDMKISDHSFVEYFKLKMDEIMTKAL